ncbi:secretion protein [Pseudomonas syringae pv. theae ICMP 3923]|uniref:Secretion protein n=1 Tax=Pseudomonas syringae pv. theae TaxID=103985 RepID=A0A0Q0GGC9_PSESX|nr:HlyD family secretion protein [Pseudomonas syringae]EPM70728.1 secretion protein [Pseudomonas syringae pv. theae ICMP 3923]KPZ35663.1 hypothetical protein AN901_205051 [Pseudomonas syringae pv. theae]MBL3831430.1 HlyD family efflux transporter periplasmic adaptor subunit [Pseudomonas syringae pv. theae]MBL3834535.1 HlyD family efflux transporter periplasmic adaptor subunit [Pseudomonas syringae pv. theae]MBL3868167.1 HlyD family efflux transporter periplasmic adaptor subunit [Pseudomonas sy
MGSELVDIIARKETPFRKEAIQARAEEYWLGTVALQSSATFLVFAWLMSFILICTVLVILFFSYSATITVQGQLFSSTALYKAYADQSGYLSYFVSAPGDAIEQGQLFATISNERYTPDGTGLTQLELNKLEQEKLRLSDEIKNARKLYDLNIEETKERLASQHADLEDLNNELKAVLNLKEKHETMVGAYRKLGKDSAITGNELLKQEDALSDLAIKVLKVKSDIKKVRSDINITNLKKNQIELAYGSESGNRFDRADSVNLSIEKAKYVSDYSIFATISGSIASTRYKQGDYISKGEEIASVLPKAQEVQIELYVDSSEIAQIQIGNVVKVKYDSYPYLKYGVYDAKISTIDHVPQPLMSTRSTPSSELNYYRVIAVLDSKNKSQTLIPGMTLQAEIIIDKTTIYDWLLKTNSVRG